MNNIPMFQAAGGLASLILAEIPKKRIAYAVLQSWDEDNLAELLDQCRTACRVSGAERIFVSAGTEPLPGLPHTLDMLELSATRGAWNGDAGGFAGSPLNLEPLNPENGALFLDIYNRVFFDVPQGKTYTARDLARIREEAQGFLAVSEGRYIGVGEVRGCELCAIGVLPEYRGMGGPLARLLLDRTEGDPVTLRTASSNDRALNLYARLGFSRPELISRWYRLF